VLSEIDIIEEKYKKEPENILKDNKKKNIDYFLKENTREENILNNLNLVYHIANKFLSNYGREYKDLISEGYKGLIKAVDTFDKNRNIKFGSYAAECIMNEIRLYLRKINKSQREVYIQNVLFVDNEGNEVTYEDILGTDNDSVSREIEKRALIKEALKSFEKLTALQRKIIIKRFGLN
jgi:RNA polymerase sporulation-specific sigma factor